MLRFFALFAVALFITACGGGGTVTPTTPAAPTNVTATPGPGHVTVTWQHDGRNVTGFDILRDTASGLRAQAAEKVGEVGTEARSYRDDGAALGASYVYSVAARNAQGASQATAQGGGPVGAASGHEVIAGTFNTPVRDQLGTTFISLYFFKEVSEDSVDGTITGPPGWNGGEPYSYFATRSSLEGRFVIFSLTDVPAVSGTYRFDITVNGEAHSATATLDASQRLPTPQNITVTSASATSVTATWDAVPGARTYGVNIHSNATSRIVAWGGSFTSPTATLSGLTLPPGEYRIVVTAYPVTMAVNQPPERPTQFNVSYDRSAPFTVE